MPARSQFAPKTPVDLIVDADASESCLYFPPAALRDMELPSWLIVEGPQGQRRLVGCKRIDGADDESTVRVAFSLLEAVAPGTAKLPESPVHVSRANWRDIVIYASG